MQVLTICVSGLQVISIIYLFIHLKFIFMPYGQWRQRVSNIGGDDLPLPIHPAPLPSTPLPSLPLPPYPPPSRPLSLEVGPLIQLGGLGERC